MSRRTWNDYEKGLITRIRGKLRKLYDFNFDEEIENFSLSCHRYDISLQDRKHCIALCKLLSKIALDHEEKVNPLPLKLYTIAPIELNGLSKNDSFKAKKLLLEKFSIPDVFLYKLEYSYYIELEHELYVSLFNAPK